MAKKSQPKIKWGSGVSKELHPPSFKKCYIGGNNLVGAGRVQAARP